MTDTRVRTTTEWGVSGRRNEGKLLDNGRRCNPKGPYGDAVVYDDFSSLVEAEAYAEQLAACKCAWRDLHVVRREVSAWEPAVPGVAAAKKRGVVRA